MRKLLIIIPIFASLAMLLGFWARPEPVPVQLVEVAKGDVETLVANTRAGTVKACRRAHLSFKTGGQVSELLIHAGQRVQAGDVLMRLRQDDLLARVEEARARLDAQRNLREQSCRQASQDQRDQNRLERLAERKLASEDLLDQSVTRARLSQLLCSGGEAKIREAAASLDLQMAQLDQATLRAPFSGIVAEINGELGEVVTPSPPGIPTPPAVDLIDDQCLYVEAPIDEVDAALVRPGMPVRITLDAFRGQSFEGRVSRIAPFVRELEKQARTVDVEVTFERVPADLLLLSGYSADVEILLAQREQTLRVPTESLLEGGKVLRYDPNNGHLREQKVEIGLANWRWSEVKGGLAPGDRILPSLQQEGLADGSVVSPSGEVGGAAR
ncbi:efflux RND transporter periplasmic adaptor subunit [Pseudomonas sp. JS3066]|jgi:HlyD family secretion protein|uniref:efflux RND transporter periplasmic adaptor subunit n=1 Tax=unclassified Pseudomonas TaxID=196821 RepID=UPI00129D9FEC|nr:MULTISPECIES: efflux RND transporter periplasmic adaptor subunit [unclassified Pseudomonas]MDH4655936.1 efflux RND transporter periplasmic adaptor subunit [Pseudomonas sp. BN606]MRK21440.1 efflux RND transporter periplasmic adaptor subunit [Pseudomonas sp. JG-B]WVK93036.1 efflux RND transporter periplasmic adaptor subunit [Pseudomonas sp. JS3066]